MVLVTNYEFKNWTQNNTNNCPPSTVCKSHKDHNYNCKGDSCHFKAHCEAIGKFNHSDGHKHGHHSNHSGDHRDGKC